MKMNERKVVEVAAQFASADWLWNLDDLPAMAAGLCLGAETFDGETRWSAILPQDLEVDFFKDEDVIVGVEVVLAQKEIDEVDSEDYEDAVDDSFRLFNEATSAIAERLGSPVFSDGAAAAGYPPDQDAVWISLWPLKNARLMLQVQHEGMDVPIRLTLVVAPPAG